MKSILVLVTSLSLSVAFAEAPIRPDGVFGSGNTGDLTLQLNFARSTAIAYVRATPPQDVWGHLQDLEARRIYKECRPDILEGLLNLSFEIVESLPEGKGFHAFMQRTGSRIRMSRSEYERGISRGLVTGPSLVAHVIHEVAHDCKLDGKPVDDAFDPLLDQIGHAVVIAGVNKNLSPFQDYVIIRDVHKGAPISFNSLSPRLREELTKKILSFAGEHVYFANRESILKRFGERPVSADRMVRTHPGSRIPTWNEVSSALPALEQIFITQFIIGSLEAKTLSRFTPSGPAEIPRQLDCRSALTRMGRGVRCWLTVNLDELPTAHRLNMRRIQLRFTLDIFGDIHVEQIVTGEQSPLRHGK